MIAGHEKVDNKVIKTIRSILDYTYMVQYPVLSEIDLQKMASLLVVFHQNKEIFVSNGLQNSDHLRIPKLHTLRHFMDDVRSGGTPDNFSTETPESLHIDMCKIPYRASNHREFNKQILNYLDIHDHLAMRHAYEEYQTQRIRGLDDGSVSTACL